MMEAPETVVLTKQQQKQTLSWKKNKQQTRTLFTSPYDTYWPVLDKNAEENFNQLLLQTLEPIRKPTIQVNWSELKKIPRQKRKEFQQKKLIESIGDVSESQEKKLRACLYLGVNAVTRGLISAGVSAVLLAKDADPKLLINHILTMCGMKGVPVLLVPTLRQITKTSLGFSCIALAIKKKGVENFETLCEMVSSLSAKIPVPEHLLSHRLVPITPQNNEKEEEPPNQESKVINISADIYKYRSSKKERVFVPGAGTKAKPSEDFLSFSMDVDDTLDKTSTFHYKPVKLITFAPNPDKIRKRELKKRRK